MVLRPGLELANLSDVGLQREQNEDYFCYAEPASEEDFRRIGRLAVVADGMGGHEGGQVASGIAIETVRDVYLTHPGDNPGEALLTAFQDAHAAIQAYAREHPELRGMGTTCTAVAMRGRELFYGHVGDSRLYLIRDSGISQVTDDHSLVGRLLRDGQITSEEATVHPDKNVLTAALGMDSAVPGDFSEVPVPLYPNDILLICTDGLHGPVNDEELRQVALASSPREACRELVRMANDRGGFDNITVQILKVM
jgi:serine/threonine protein phosphatase PrpC